MSAPAPKMDPYERAVRLAEEWQKTTETRKFLVAVIELAEQIGGFDHETKWRDHESPTLETGPAPEVPEMTWICSICDRSNYVTVTHCEQCEYSRMVMRGGRSVPRDGQR